GMKAGGGDKADSDCPCDRPQKRVGCQPAELIGQDEPSAKTAEQRPAIAAQLGQDEGPAHRSAVKPAPDETGEEERAGDTGTPRCSGMRQVSGVIHDPSPCTDAPTRASRRTERRGLDQPRASSSSASRSRITIWCTSRRSIAPRRRKLVKVRLT